MKKHILFFGLAVVIAITACQQQKLHYPVARKTDQADDYFGTKVPDPYRWLENDTSAETAAWVKAENEVTFGYLEKIPFRDKIRERITEIWNYPRMSSPWKAGGYYFFTKNDGLQNQSVYYMMDSLGAEPRIILDPNTLSKDGTVALTAFNVSRDGKYLAYGISRGGSDWREFFVKDVKTGKNFDDHLQWIKFSGIAWFGDGFFYSRFTVPETGKELSAENKNNRVYFHETGTRQDQDVLIYEDSQHPDWSFYPSVTEDERFLVISVMKSTSGNALYIKDLSKNNEPLIPLVKDFDNDYWVVDHRNGKIYIMTNNEAPMYRLVAISDKAPDMTKAITILPENAEQVLTGVTFGGGKLIAGYMKDAHDIYSVFDPDGTFLHDVELPSIGSVGGFNARYKDNTAFYTFTSFTFPSVVFRYDIERNISTEWFKPKIDFDFDRYVTEQVFYPGKDSTMIPMFIVHRKDMELNGKNPTWLYGYGGFNISLTPSFRVSRLIWLENGGVYAMANLRGGGEYGEKWHEAGTKMNKQNVFDDFIYAAKYLINKKYTSPEYLACQGGSNGGLLIGAVINQAPELFRVALPAVGVMDMLRYHKFTIGRFWAADYGTSEDSKEMFEYLYHYSPLHNIKPGLPYPAVLITTADHDDRVVPAHSFKYAATLQSTYKGPNPVLIRIETKAGHGSGKPTTKRIEEATDLYSFTFYNMGITPKY
ncbi:MAG: S9 family peptidase [Chlorobi bacterium]|nr:S9 family peptidase [Chlorobiota bacterium]